MVEIGKRVGCTDTDYFAILTYISMIQSPTLNQEYCYRIIDLSTGAIGAENVIRSWPYATTPFFRNWAAVHDLGSPGFVFVFGEQYQSGSGRMFQGQLDAAFFDGCGTNTGLGVLQYYDANTMDEIRACYDPDPSNYGAYVVWRETPSSKTTPGDGATINLLQVNTVSGSLWSTGVISHVPSNTAHRGEPVVCADLNWVFVAWADMRKSSASQIFGTPWSSVGTALSLTNINGTMLSGLRYEAHHPDVIVNPDVAANAMVAWDEDCNATSNGFRNIKIKNCPVLGTSLLGDSLTIATPHATPNLAGSASMTDARWSLYGYMQRRPKLIAVNASLEAWPYDRTGTYTNLNHWVVCAFECEAYNLYGSGASCSGGGSLSGKYSDLWTDEAARPGAPYGGYLQNNIVAQVINPNLVAGSSPTQPLIGGEMCIGASSNAQDLFALVYSDSIGPIAGILEYENTINANGRAQRIITRPYYYFDPANPVLSGLWHAPSSSDTANNLVFANASWEPLFIHLGAGSPTSGTPSGTWTVNASNTTMTLNFPGFVHPLWFDYVSPGFSNALRVSGYVEHIAGQWPLNPPDAWAHTGDVTAGGYGLKPSVGSRHTSPDGAFEISLSENPAANASNALIKGIVGNQANIRVLDILGNVMQSIDGITIGAGGTEIPLDVHSWSSGSYVVEALAVDGSRTSMILSVNH